MSTIVIERPPAFAPALLRQAYSCFPSGVIALCGLAADGTPRGMAVSSFGTVSLDPALAHVCIQNSSATWPELKSMRRLGVSVLAGHQGAVASALAAKTGNRFAGISWEANANGAVFIHDASLWLETAIETEAAAGDHSISLLRIWSVDSRPDVTPLIFHGSRFRNLQPDCCAPADPAIRSA